MPAFLYPIARAAAHPADAVARADIIVTCTTARAPILGPDDVAPGQFIAAVGADSEGKHELDARLLARARVVTDLTAQSARMGDLQHAIAAGLMTAADVHAEIGQINSLEPPVFQIQGSKPVVLFPQAIKQGELKLGVN